MASFNWLMIIRDLDVGGAGRCPAETDPVLAIDADAVLTAAVTAEGFQLVGRRRPQVIQPDRLIELVQFAARDRPKGFGTDSTSRLAVKPVKEFFAAAICERLDHSK